MSTNIIPFTPVRQPDGTRKIETNAKPAFVDHSISVGLAVAIGRHLQAKERAKQEAVRDILNPL